MQNEQKTVIIEYLTQNKFKYSQESLVTQLKNVGYADDVIWDAVASVYDKNSLQDIEKASVKTAVRRKDISKGILYGFLCLMIVPTFIGYFSEILDRLYDQDILVILCSVIFVLCIISWSIYMIVKKSRTFLVAGFFIGLIGIPLLFAGGCFMLIAGIGLF